MMIRPSCLQVELCSSTVAACAHWKRSGDRSKKTYLMIARTTNIYELYELLKVGGISVQLSSHTVIMMPLCNLQ